jgi:acyl-CoA thioester hydrolase
MLDEAHPWPDLAGRVTPDGHVLPVRVYYEDTDFSGVVYHASYLRFLERGRSDFMRLLGLDHKALLERAVGESVAFAVRRMTIDWIRPARIDEVLEVVTSPADLRGASLDLSQSIRRAGEVLVTALVKVVLVDGQGRARRVPDALRSVLSKADEVLRGQDPASRPQDGPSTERTRE